MVTAAAFLVQRLDVITLTRQQTDRLGCFITGARLLESFTTSRFEGDDTRIRWIGVRADQKLGSIIAAQEEMIISALGRGQIAVDTSAVIVPEGTEFWVVVQIPADCDWHRGETRQQTAGPHPGWKLAVALQRANIGTRNATVIIPCHQARGQYETRERRAVRPDCILADPGILRSGNDQAIGGVRHHPRRREVDDRWIRGQGHTRHRQTTRERVVNKRRERPRCHRLVEGHPHPVEGRSPSHVSHGRRRRIQSHINRDRRGG